MTDVKPLYAAAVNTVRRIMPPDDERFDDMVQEFVIAAWQAGAGKRDPLTYGKVAGRNHVARVLQGRKPMTGSGTAGHRSHDQARQTARRGEMVDRPGRDRVEEAAVAGVELARPLAGLPDHERLIAAGVAHDRPWDRIAPAVGLAPVTVKNKWQREIKPRLRSVAA